jgi:hypothetical protein
MHNLFGRFTRSQPAEATESDVAQATTRPADLEAGQNNNLTATPPARAAEQRADVSRNPLKYGWGLYFGPHFTGVVESDEDIGRAVWRQVQGNADDYESFQQGLERPNSDNTQNGDVSGNQSFLSPLRRKDAKKNKKNRKDQTVSNPEIYIY